MDLGNLEDDESDVAPPSDEGDNLEDVDILDGGGSSDGDGIEVPFPEGEESDFEAGKAQSDAASEMARRKSGKAASIFAQHLSSGGKRPHGDRGARSGDGGGVGGGEKVQEDETIQTVYVPRDVHDLQQALKYRLMMQPKTMPLSSAEEAHCISLIQSHLISHGFHRTATALKNTCPKTTSALLPSYTGSGGVGRVGSGSGPSASSRRDASIIVAETARKVGHLFDDDSSWPTDNLTATRMHLPMVDSHSQAQGGSIDMLIEKLIFDDSSFVFSDRGECIALDISAINYSSVFLVTACCFVTPDALFSKLCKLFKTIAAQKEVAPAAPASTTTATPTTKFTTISEVRKTTLLKRILNFLTKWTSLGSIDFRRVVSERIASFALSIVRTTSQGYHDEVRQLAERLVALVQDLLHSTEPPGAFPSVEAKIVDTVPATIPLDAEVRRVMDAPDEELSRQLTLAHFRLFAKIRPRELYNAAWDSIPLKTIAGNLNAFINFPGEIMLWFASLIVSPPNADHRKAMYAKTVRIAHNLYDKQNYFLAFQLKEACDHPAVAALLTPQTALTPAEGEIYQALTASVEALTTQKKKELRINVETAHIPHASVYLSQMAAAHESMNTFIKGDPKDPAATTISVNWSKMLTMGRVILSFVSLQSFPYPYQAIPNYQRLIVQQPGKRDRESLEALSQERLGIRR